MTKLKPKMSPVVTDSEDHAAGHENEWHSHDEPCLIYPADGVVAVETEDGGMLSSPQRAIWLGAGVRHRSKSTGKVALRSLRLNPDRFPDLESESHVIGITPLLRELILQVCATPPKERLDNPEGRMVAVIADQLKDLQSPALPLTLPQDKRLKRLVDGLLESPGDNRSLEDWGREVGASGRTLSRLFRAETGMTFRDWREHLRVIEAMRRLAEGQSVTSIAFDIGYDSPSAFVQMFKKVIGQTPARFRSAAPGP